MRKDRKLTELTKDNNNTKATFRLPNDLLNQYKHLAIDKNTTVTALIIEAMKEYISKGGSRLKK